MANTYTQLYVHIVFAVKNRRALIHPDWDQELYAYIGGIINSRGHKALAINGMPDHIHIFVGLHPRESISDLVREIKKASNKWVKFSGYCPFKFEWQSGFGAFSNSHSEIGRVINYIAKQKEHHGKQSFKKEYLEFLKKWEVDYNPDYTFDWIDPAD